MLPIDQLIKAPTTDQVKQSIYDLMGSMGLPVTAWQKGGAFRLFVAVMAAMIVLVFRLVAVANRSNFLDLATGSWLIHRAKQNYDVDWIGPSRASTPVTLTNAGGGIYPIEPGELIVQDQVTQKLFQNVDFVSVGALATVTGVQLEALEAGSDSSAAAGDLTILVTPYPGVTCTNPSAAVGLDGYSEDELRQLCRDSLGRLSPFGPEAAFVYWAKVAKRLDGSHAGVTRVWVSPSGIPVQVYVAGASGAIAGTVGDTSTALGCVDASVQEHAVTNPVTCNVDSATDVDVDVDLTVYVDKAANLTDQEVIDLAEGGVKAFFRSTKNPIGGLVISPASGKLYVKSIEQAAKAASPYFLKVDVALPAADVAIAEGEIAKYGTIDVTPAQIVVPS